MYAAVAFTIIGMTSCNKEKDGCETLSREVKFHASIERTFRVSGASGDQWEMNDPVGIFMKAAGGALNTKNLKADNIKYLSDAVGIFTAAQPGEAISFPADGSDVDFIAYYPYSSVDGDFDMEVDISTQSPLKNIDIMYSNDATNRNSSNSNAGVALTFSHVMSKFVLHIGSDDDTNLTGLKVEFVGVNTKSTFSVIDGSLDDDMMSSGTVEAITTVGSPNTSAIGEAILLPVAALTGGVIKFTLGSKTFTWDIPNGQTYEGGKKYTYNFTLKTAGTTVILDGAATIIGWADEPVVNRIVNPAVPVNFFEDFEDEVWKDVIYAGKDITDCVGDWRVVGSGNMDTSDRRNGTRSIRLRGNSGDTCKVVMKFDKTGGMGVVSFAYASYAAHSDGQISLYYSTNQGANWILKGSVNAPPWDETEGMLTATFTLNIAENARIKIARDGTLKTNTTVNIDDIKITDYSD